MYRNVFLGAILLSMPLVVWSQQDTIADQRFKGGKTKCDKLSYST